MVGISTYFQNHSAPVSSSSYSDKKVCKQRQLFRLSSHSFSSDLRRHIQLLLVNDELSEAEGSFSTCMIYPSEVEAKYRVSVTEDSSLLSLTTAGPTRREWKKDHTPMQGLEQERIRQSATEDLRRGEGRKVRRTSWKREKERCWAVGDPPS